MPPKTEFPRGERLLLLEHGTAGGGDVTEIRGSRDTVHHFGDVRGELPGDGQRRLGPQGVARPFIVHHRFGR